MQQLRGDLDGALVSYQKAVVQLARAGQDSGAGDALESLAAVAMLTGRTSAVLSFVSQQRLHGEEFPAQALLEAVHGDPTARDRALQQYAETHNWITPHFIEQQRNLNDMFAAMARSDGHGVLAVADRLPDLTAVGVLFTKARASLLLNDYGSAERGFSRTVVESRIPPTGDFRATLMQVPLYSILSRYYLAQVYEATGRSQQAIEEYQSFLSHFEGSRTGLPQVVQARSALKKLMR
jgi:tetratricopeptide (TPR) repeat protein